MLGRLLGGKRQDVDSAAMGLHVLGWVVKGFYLPYMFSYLAWNIGELTVTRPIINSFSDFYDTTWSLVWVIDAAFVSVGYLCTLRLFDTQIRSVEPTVFGWLVCLVVYSPFWPGIRSAFFEYEGLGIVHWGGWLRGTPPAHVAWGVAILALMAIFTWTNLTFGLRFSNLTHRGILTSGPYRWTKHPHYVSKNLSWWLICVPFINSEGPGAAFRACCLLLAVNVIYFLRLHRGAAPLPRPGLRGVCPVDRAARGVALVGRLLPWLTYSRLHAAAVRRHPPLAAAGGERPGVGQCRFCRERQPILGLCVTSPGDAMESRCDATPMN